MKNVMQQLLVLEALSTTMDNKIYVDPDKPVNKLKPQDISIPEFPDLVVPKDCKAYYFTKTGRFYNDKRPGVSIIWQCVARTREKAEAKYRNWCTGQLQSGLMKAVNNAVGVINNANPVMQIPAAILIHISDEEFISRYNDKSGSTIYYGDLATIEEVEERAKLLNLK